MTLQEAVNNNLVFLPYDEAIKAGVMGENIATPCCYCAAFNLTNDCNVADCNGGLYVPKDN